MQLTIFGILWMVLLVFVYFKHSIKELIALLMFSSVLQASAVFIVGNQGLRPFLITGLALIIKYHFYYKTIKFDKVTISASNFFLVTVLVTVITAVVFVGLPIVVDGNNLTQTTYDGRIGFYRFFILFVLIYCYIIIYSYKNHFNETFIEKTIYVITLFVLIVGFVQFFIVCGVIPRFYLFTVLFYSNSASNLVYLKWPDLQRFYSTFNESSYCSAYLVGVFWYYIAKYKKSYNILLIVLVIAIYLTKSTTAYVAFLLGFGIFLLFGKTKKIQKILIISIIVLGLIIFATSYGNLISDIILSKIQDNMGLTDSSTTVISSGTMRRIWNENAFTTFKNTHFWGIGYKVIRASSLLISILGEIGIIGFISYMWMIITISKKLLQNKINQNSRAAFLMIIVVFFCQVMACPDLDFCVFWLAMYIGAASLKKSNKYENTIIKTNYCEGSTKL